MKSVKFKNVSKKYDNKLIINSLNFQVNAGELFFLLGPSGCGKTTCLRLIAGFIKPDEGEIFFDEMCVNKIPPNKRNAVLVFQNYALWPHMNVYENLEFGLEVRKIPKRLRKEKIMEALKAVKMEAHYLKYPGTLSGGEQQRIALARALAVKPDILLLDEPLSNLDAHLRAQMREEIKNIHSKWNITTIFVTHDQKEALSVGEKIAILKDGKIHQIGTPEEIYNKPSNRFIAEFIGDKNYLNGLFWKKTGSKTVIKTSIGDILINSSSLENSKNIDERKEINVFIKPETIIIYNTQEEKLPNLFEATLIDKIYQGESTTLIFSKNGINLKVITFNIKPETYTINTKFFLHIPPDDILAFADEH